MAGLDVILIGVHTDGEEITLGSRFEYAFTGTTCDLINNIRTLVVLTEGSLKTQAWAGEVKAKIAHQDFAVRADRHHTLFVTIEQLAQTGRIATDDCSYCLGLGARA